MNKKELKERLWDAVDEYEELLRYIGTTLYEHPETGKNEYKAAAELNFEEAAALRDKMIEINQYLYENK